MSAGSSEPLFEVIQAFIQAETWAAAQRVIEAHPELLSEEADRLLGQLVALAHQQGDPQAADTFAAHRQLLAQCRRAGGEVVFAKRVPEESEIPSELEAFLRALPPEQRQILLDALERPD